MIRLRMCLDDAVHRLEEQMYAHTGHTITISRYDIARKADISNPTIERLWNDPLGANPKIRTLEKIAAALTSLIHERCGLTIEVSPLAFVTEESG